MLRYKEPGWQEVDVPDGRRGVWVRTDGVVVELCAGREGDDAYVKLCPGVTPVDLFTLNGLRDVLEYYAFAVELGAEDTQQA